MSRVRVMIAEDNEVMRDALTDVIAAEQSLDLIGACRDGATAIELACAERPDVAILDVKMPSGGGPRAATEILACSPQTQILALSAFSDRAAVLEMVRAGAVGYLVKGTSSSSLVQTVHRVALGESILSSEVTGDVVQELASHLQQRGRVDGARRQAVGRIGALIAQGGPEMAFQPIVDLSTGAPVGFEALARFPDGAERSPAEWFREAGEAGVGPDLELAAARTALVELPRLASGSYLSFNLTPLAACTADLKTLLDSHPNPRLVVEVTEHEAVRDYDGLLAALASFRERGGRLAVDDAGAGFASLRHILRLSPDIIKLDTALTRDIATDAGQRALASSLITFARETGATIVAEGIETNAQLAVLRDLGVPCGQGYILGRPVPHLPAAL